MPGDKKGILQGIVVSKFGDRGPEAIASYPNVFKDTILTEISIKAVSILAGEDGAVPPPENLSVLPLPKLKMASVIHIFEIKDEQARGGVVTHTLSMLFNQKYTPVIYKMMEDLANLTTPADTLIEKINNNEDLSGFLVSLYHQIANIIENREKDEVTRFKIIPGMEKKYEHKYSFKVIVIGDPSVGKTTLLLRYIDKAFRELYIPTIGVQVSMKFLEYDEKTQVKLHLWDIAGQEIFKQVREKFYTGCHAVIIMYDVTNKRTFKNIKKWHKDMVNLIGKKAGFLVGNKIDLPPQVKKFNAQDLAYELELEFAQTSAKTGENVDMIFEKIAELLIKK